MMNARTTIRPSSALLVAAALALACPIPTERSNAAVLFNADGNGNLSPRFPEDATFFGDRFGFRYRVRLDPLPAVALAPPGPANPDTLALGAEFPAPWVFVAGGPAPGSFNVLAYDTDVDAALPVPFQIDYLPGPLGAPGPNLNFVQLIHTNDPILPGLPNPYVDPQPNDDPVVPLPFYWTIAEAAANAIPGGGLRFTDRPERPLIDALILLGGVDWEADLYLTSWNGALPGGAAAAPVVTIYDGVRWGFEIVCISRGLGPNQTGGVAGDKGESRTSPISGPLNPPPRCLDTSVPAPGTAPLFAAAVAGLVAVAGRRARAIKA